MRQMAANLVLSWAKKKTGALTNFQLGVGLLEYPA